MNKRGTGVAFCFIATMLFASRYIAAAIFGSGVTSWEKSLFNGMLEYVGSPLLILSAISLIAGIGYLVWAEKEKE